MHSRPTLIRLGGCGGGGRPRPPYSGVRVRRVVSRKETARRVGDSNAGLNSIVVGKLGDFNARAERYRK